MSRGTVIGGRIGLAALLILAGCGTQDLLGPDAPQGIDGTVLLGPQCPVASQEDPCPDLPYQAWIVIRRSDGHRITRIRSDEGGRFRVGLSPGSYVLDPQSGDPFPIAAEQEVAVEAGRYTDVLVSFDTGIR